MGHTPRPQAPRPTATVYRLWLSALEPVDDSAPTRRAIRTYKLAFWAIALGWNMPSWYLLQPLIRLSWQVVGYRLGVQGPADCLVMWTWVAALFPIHKLEQLLVLRPREAKPKAATELI